jgi:hypothetical protein
MSDSSLIHDTLMKSGRSNRRRFLTQAGIAGIAGLGVLSANPFIANAQTGTPTDADVLNFALNLEYLEAEFYLRAAFGRGLNDADTNGNGTKGSVTGGRQVSFATESVRQYANEIAADEEAHVKFLRSALGTAARAPRN